MTPTPIPHLRPVTTPIRKPSAKTERDQKAWRDEIGDDRWDELSKDWEE